MQRSTASYKLLVRARGGQETIQPTDAPTLDAARHRAMAVLRGDANIRVVTVLDGTSSGPLGSVRQGAEEEWLPSIAYPLHRMTWH